MESIFALCPCRTVSMPKSLMVEGEAQLTDQEAD